MEGAPICVRAEGERGADVRAAGTAEGLHLHRSPFTWEAECPR